jgi:hypothetical protein
VNPAAERRAAFARNPAPALASQQSTSQHVDPDEPGAFLIVPSWHRAIDASSTVAAIRPRFLRDPEL